MPGNPLAKQQIEAVQRAAALVLQAHAGSKTAAAKAIGISQPALSNLINHGTGAGAKTVRGISIALGWSMDEVVGDASHADQPGLAEALVARSWPPWVRVAARSRQNLDGGTMSADKWVAWMSGLVVADGVTAASTSAQEQAFDRKKATRKRG